MARRAPAAPPAAAPAARAARTQVLIEGALLPTLLRLAAPNVLLMAVQAAVSGLDAYFVGWLGAPALAGVALVFPLAMLMQTMAAGGMGGGVASAVARALGAGRREEADALAVHALVIAVVMAGAFTAGALAAGPALYHVMGGRGPVLAAAVSYSRVLFGGAAAFWLLHILAAVVRGTGVMAVPAAITTASGLVYVLLAPGLILGWGPLPTLGVAGAAAASVSGFGMGALVLLAYLGSGRCPARLSLRGLRLRPALFWEILRVGAPGALNTVLTNLSVALLTALVAPFGPAALAGYGLGTRLEYLQIPLVFGFGSALVAMVGTNVGAGRLARAERVAWTGAGLAAAVTGSIGLAAALAPRAWLTLFSSDTEVIAAGTAYLRIAGPVYAFFGLGLGLYFASQGAGRLGWPLLAGVLRLAIAGIGGWIAIHWLGGGLHALFSVVALALVVYGATVAGAIKAGAWRAGRRWPNAA